MSAEATQRSRARAQNTGTDGCRSPYRGGRVFGSGNERRNPSGKKLSDQRPRKGLNTYVNRRFREQIGGLLIRGSEVRILPGALAAMRVRDVRDSSAGPTGNESGNTRARW